MGPRIIKQKFKTRAQIAGTVILLVFICQNTVWAIDIDALVRGSIQAVSKKKTEVLSGISGNDYYKSAAKIYNAVSTPSGRTNIYNRGTDALSKAKDGLIGKVQEAIKNRVPTINFDVRNILFIPSGAYDFLNSLKEQAASLIAKTSKALTGILPQTAAASPNMYVRDASAQDKASKKDKGKQSAWGELFAEKKKLRKEIREYKEMKRDLKESEAVINEMALSEKQDGAEKVSKKEEGKGKSPDVLYATKEFFTEKKDIKEEISENRKMNKDMKEMGTALDDIGSALEELAAAEESSGSGLAPDVKKTDPYALNSEPKNCKDCNKYAHHTRQPAKLTAPFQFKKENKKEDKSEAPKPKGTVLKKFEKKHIYIYYRKPPEINKRPSPKQKGGVTTMLAGGRFMNVFQNSGDWSKYAHHAGTPPKLIVPAQENKKESKESETQCKLCHKNNLVLTKETKEAILSAINQTKPSAVSEKKEEIAGGVADAVQNGPKNITYFKQRLNETTPFYNEKKTGDSIYFTKVTAKDDPSNGEILAIIDTKKGVIVEYYNYTPVSATNMDGSGNTSFSVNKDSKTGQYIITDNNSVRYDYRATTVNRHETLIIKEALPAEVTGYLQANEQSSYESMNNGHIMVYTDKKVYDWSKTGTKEYTIAQSGYNSKLVIVKDSEGNIYNYGAKTMGKNTYIVPKGVLPAPVQEYIEHNGGYFENSNDVYYHYNEYGNDKAPIFMVKGTGITRYEQGVPKETTFTDGKAPVTYSAPKDGVVTDSTGKEWKAVTKYFDTAKGRVAYVALVEKPTTVATGIQTLSKEKFHPVVKKQQTDYSGFIKAEVRGNNIYYYHYDADPKNNKLANKTLIGVQDQATGDYTQFIWWPENPRQGLPGEGFPSSTYDAKGNLLKKYTPITDQNTGRFIKVVDEQGKTYAKHQLVRLTPLPSETPSPSSTQVNSERNKNTPAPANHLVKPGVTPKTEIVPTTVGQCKDCHQYVGKDGSGFKMQFSKNQDSKKSAIIPVIDIGQVSKNVKQQSVNNTVISSTYIPSKVEMQIEDSCKGCHGLNVAGIPKISFNTTKQTNSSLAETNKTTAVSQTAQNNSLSQIKPLTEAQCKLCHRNNLPLTKDLKDAILSAINQTKPSSDSQVIQSNITKGQPQAPLVAQLVSQTDKAQVTAIISSGETKQIFTPELLRQVNPASVGNPMGQYRNDGTRVNDSSIYNRTYDIRATTLKPEYNKPFVTELFQGK